MIEFLVVVITGLLLGTIAGLMPGIGVSLIVISLFPVLSNLAVPMALLFYITLCCTMQYYGSISAIVFGVVGEITSVPAVNNGHELFRRGYGDYALASTATSSFIAALIGIALFLLFFQASDVLMSLMSAKIKVFTLLLVLVIIVAACKSKIAGGIATIAGLVIGSAGSDIVPYIDLIIPRYGFIDGGVPMATLMAGLIAVPTILFYAKTEPDADKMSLATQYLLNSFSQLKIRAHLPSILRGSAVGCIVGLIPGVSYVISSNMAELLERKINNRSTSDHSLIKNLLSAEAANNSGMIVVLIPLLLFALPIVPSEAILLSAVELNGFSHLYGTNLINQYMLLLIATLICVNVINWAAARYFYKHISDIYYRSHKYVYPIALMLTVLLTLVSGYVDNQLLLAFCTLIFFTVAGMLVSDINIKLAFVFAFFMSSILLPEMYRFYLIVNNYAILLH